VSRNGPARQQAGGRSGVLDQSNSPARIPIEVDPRLAQDARRALASAGYHPLVITGDGLTGYPPGAPYDRVSCTASVREVVPRTWLDQLRPGGRLVTP
jgi:protein-L-isoaspartate O-methyltransferase